jgi:cobalt-precorrin-5B (C1)-methyltransferase
VTISVPGGEAMAKKTLNARLGILGGISILGTTGIVRPYSTAAFRASVVQAVDVAAKQGQTSVVFTTGGRTEKFAMRQLPDSTRPASCRWATSSRPLSRPRSSTKHAHIYRRRDGRQADQDVPGTGVTHAWKAEIDRDCSPIGRWKSARRPTWPRLIRAAETARFAAERLANLGLTEAFPPALAGGHPQPQSLLPRPYRSRMLVCDFEGCASSSRGRR